MTTSFTVSKSLSFLCVILPLVLCFTSIHATHVPGHYGFHATIVPPAAAYSYLNIPSLAAGMPIWSPYHSACRPYYGISPFATGVYAPAFAAQAGGAPFFNQLQANQLFNQLQANQFFNQQQANQLFSQQQANQAFNQMEANQLFNQIQTSQAFNQQQANQLFMNAQLANYLTFPRGSCPAVFGYPSTRAVIV